MKHTEASLQTAVCKYLMYQYPQCMFNSDLSGSMKLTEIQAKRMKALRSGRAFPDLHIMEKKNNYGALFIELKAEGTKLFKKNGDPITDHVAEQIECIKKLKDRGYYACICIGFEQTKETIDNYMRGYL